MTQRKLFVELGAGLIALLYIYAATSKFLDFKTFVGELNNQPLPNSLTPFLSLCIPIVEILTSVLLVWDRTRVVAFGISILIMATFTTYTALILLNAFSRVPCSCGGIIKRLSWGQHLALNIVFLALSTACWRYQMKIGRFSKA